MNLFLALLIGPVENCPKSSPVRLLIQKLFRASDEGFKIASSIALQTRYLHSIQIRRVIRCMVIVPFVAFFDSSHGGIVERMYARRAPIHLLNLRLRLAAVGSTLQ